MPHTFATTLAWEMAVLEARALNHKTVEPDHLFLGLCSLDKMALRYKGQTSVSAEDLQSLAMEQDALERVLAFHVLEATRLRRRMRQRLGSGTFTPREGNVVAGKAVLKLYRQAEAMAAPMPASCLHLLGVVLQHPTRALRQVLGQERAEAKVLIRKLSGDLLDHASSLQDLALRARADARPLQGPAPAPEAASTAGPGPSDAAFLSRYGRDLTEEARQGAFDKIAIRRDLLLRLIQTVTRHRKANPLLIGEPGVGKTAVVEALARRMAHQKDAALRGKQLIQLDVGTLLGGTGNRGDLEARLQGLLDELARREEVILFIDEIHSLLGNREVADFFKPALARGQIRCIGATTISEFRKYIEKDPALERRFQVVMIEEPDREEALEMLKAVAAHLAAHHHVHFPEETLAAAVDLSSRFDRDHTLPDKAIDLIDQAAARTQVPALSLGATPEGSSVSLLDVPAAPIVLPITIAQVLSEKIRVPVDLLIENLEENTRSRLIRMPEVLKGRIRGQDEAIACIGQRLQLAQVDLSHRHGPLAVFLFLGPSGVGKTEVAKQLAMFLFGSAEHLIRLDMSEYKEQHALARLIGAPPGYIGHDEEGQLTGRLRTSPHAIVLLDEIEKGHPRILDLFLQVFDEGRLTDAKGRTVDARHAIFVMTSNLKKGGAEARAGGEVEEWFRPELLNRIDEVITFNGLSEADIGVILDDYLQHLQMEVQARYQVQVRVDEETRAFLLEAGYRPSEGARGLRKAVEQHLEVPITQMVLSGKLSLEPLWQTEVVGKQIRLRPTNERPAEKAPAWIRPWAKG